MKLILITNFSKKPKSNALTKRGRKKILFDAHMHLLQVEKKFIDGFKSGIFPLVPIEDTERQT